MGLSQQDRSAEVNWCVSTPGSSLAMKRQRGERKSTPATPVSAATCTTSTSRPRSCGEFYHTVSKAKLWWLLRVPSQHQDEELVVYRFVLKEMSLGIYVKYPSIHSVVTSF